MNHLLPAVPAGLDSLKATVSGTVLTQEDPGFAESLSSWNLVIRHNPAVVVIAESAADVQAAVKFAKANGLPVAVQATGHGQFRTCDSGVLIRTHRMNAVQIDVASMTARIAAGAQWKDVLAQAQPFGLGGISGSAPHVGVVGYTLGGGFGILSRKYGLAVDLVKSIQMVNADGELLTLSPSENEDLFFAVRGGGGGFGVVTEIEMELHPDGEIYGGTVIYPAEMNPEVYAKFAGWSKELPDSASVSLSLLNLPPLEFIPEPLRGKAVIALSACFTGSDEEAVELLAPMRALGGIIMDDCSRVPYIASGVVHKDPVDPIPAQGRGVLLREMDEQGMRTLLEAIGPAHQSPTLKIELRLLGGKARQGSGVPAAVDSRRSAAYLLYLIGVPNPMVSEEAICEHANRVISALSDRILCPGPLNFIGERNITGEEIKCVFDEQTWTQLCRTKAMHDPENVFRFAGLGLP